MSDPSDWISSRTLDEAAPAIGAPTGAASPGDAASRYERVALIGEGGMGRVWLGWDSEIGRNVAIKEPSGAAGSPSSLRLQREVTLTALLEHPGVPAVYDVFTLEGRPNVVMEMIRGQTLGALLERELTRSTIARHVLNVCEILAHAHRHGVLHRDVTHANVLIEDSGATRLIDWGMAISLDDAADGPPPGGTPGFMAPEQRAGAPLDARADVWALGALLHVALYGAPPGDSTRDPHLGATPLDAICARALSHDPGDRYQGADHMARDLLGWFEGQRVEAFETSPWRVARWFMERHRARILAAAAAAAALLVALSYGGLRTRDEARRARQAESAAIAQGRRANASSARARREASAAEAAEARLRLRAAGAALDSGDILEARAQLALATPLASSPEARGLRMRLELIPRPLRRDLRALPPCSGRLVLTDAPSLLLCRTSPTSFEAWRDLDLAWRVDLSGLLGDDPNNNHIKDIRITEGALVVRANLDGVFSMDLSTGATTTLASGFPRFASPLDALLLTRDTRSWVASGAPTACPGEVVHAHAGAGERVTLCSSGRVWLEASGRRAESLYDGNLGHAHYYARVARGQERWIATSDGLAWPVGGDDRRVRLGAPLRSMAPIPGSTSLLLREWDGAWRVLDTTQGDWTASFEASTLDVRPTTEGALQVLTAAGLELWDVPSPEVTRRYRADYGFTDLAWSHDSRHLAMTSAGAMIHHVTPRGGERAAPATFGLDVMKSVTALQGGGFVAVNALPPPDVALPRFDLVGGALRARPFVRLETWSGSARRIEWMRDGSMFIVSTAGTLARIEGPLDASRGALLSEQNAFIDLDADHTRQLAVALGHGSLRIFGVDGRDVTRPAPAGARHVSITSDGRYVACTRDAILVHDASGALTHTLDAPSAVVSVTWRPGTDLVVTGHVDGAVHVWDAARGAHLAYIRHHHGRVAAVEASPDGELLATASWDTTARVVPFSSLDRDRHPPRKD